METASIEQWMKLALEQASRAADVDEVPVGALLVCNGGLIGSGYNRRETSFRTIAHAEIMALEDYNFRFSAWRLPPQTVLIVTAEPCLMCAGALIAARVDEILYGCKDPRNAGISNLLALMEKGAFDHRPSRIEGGFFATQTAGILSDFFKKKRCLKVNSDLDSRA